MTYPLPVRANRLNKSDVAALEAAVAALEKNSFARRLAHLAGRQVGFAGRMIPQKLQQAGAVAARRALFGAMRVAVASLKGKPLADRRARHRRMAAISGAIGGALGLASLPIELPLSTTIMLRSIADIARSEGEDSADPQAAMACLEVFALGGHGEDEKSWRAAISRCAVCSPNPFRKPRPTSRKPASHRSRRPRWPGSSP